MNKLINIGKTYKLFVASSMKDSCRHLVEGIIGEVNNKLEEVGLKIELIAYGEKATADHEDNTQQMLNHLAATSDILVVLATNNVPIGKWTFGEYRAAHYQSLNDPNKRPGIKVFVLYEQRGENMSINYQADDDTLHDFQATLYEDSGRYPTYLLRSRFKTFFKDWLMAEVRYGMSNNIKQGELSYETHLHRIGQGSIRKSTNRYYRRDNLDGQIEKVFQTSPIVILEGNTYSGKTRAAFEFMKTCKEWKDCNFHIYDNRYSTKDLNRIPYIDYSGSNRGDVFLIDDINDILKKRTDENLNPRRPLWRKLNGYNGQKGFSLNDFGKARIIFTVSGKLSSSQKKDLYKQIFNIREDGVLFFKNLERIRINFDIYDQYSFQKMVNAMVRDGVLKRANIRPGNFTIGSLFIRTEDIRYQIEGQKSTNRALLLALVGHFKYAAKSRFMGLVHEIKDLYQFVCRIENYEHTERFEDGIERLRQQGLVVTISEENRIFIDKYILEVLNEVVIKDLQYRSKTSVYALNRVLIDYAVECQEIREDKRKLTEPHICCVAQMAYLLVDRNQPDDDEIRDLTTIVASRLLSYRYKKGRKNVIMIMELVDIASMPGCYPINFASSAIAHIKDFEEVDDLLNTCYNYYKHCNENAKEQATTAIDLYKQAVYAMFSAGNRVMTMAEEQRVMNRILDDQENWKAPFGDKDLEDVFNLARLTRYRKKMTAQQIIELLPNATLKGVEMPDNDWSDSADTDKTLAEDGDEFANVETSSEIDDGRDAEEPNRIYEKIFLKQLDNTAINASCRIHSFEEFLEVVASLQAMCDKSIHVKRAIERFFTREFYRMAPRVVKNMNYSDRYEFFQFILRIDDKKGALGNVSVQNEYVEILRASRIHLLNELLVYLDESAALAGYETMIDNGLCNMMTLSYLLKNEFLNFEQLVRLVGKDDGQTNFITLNQLMGKVETLSDANVCMRLMGINDCDPCKIRDENALIKYLQIKYIDDQRCIQIIKGRRQLFKDALSDAVITSVLDKFNIKQLIDIFFQSAENIAQGYYWEHYGFLDEEIEKMRKNAIHLNMLFYKANSCGSEITELMRRKFEEICQSDELRPLIADPECNGKNGILSVYMKNRTLFPSYQTVRDFYNKKLSEECKPQKVNHYIFSVFLWNIIDAYKKETYDRSTAIQLFNGELIRAYEEFAKQYASDDVISMMANLYHYRPLLTDEDCFDKPEEYVYENQILEISYIKYLELLIEKNPAFVDGTFIFNTLTMMKKGVNNEVYDRLVTLASLNHIGVKYDTIFKMNKDKAEPILAREVQQRLFKIDTGSGTFDIDKNLVCNVSYIKVLWYLLYNGLIPFESAETYRINNNIPITETYLNMALKCMENDVLKEWKRAQYDNRVLQQGYNRMIDYMNKVFLENSYIHKSIQMCLALIAVAPDEESLNQIFSDDGFIALENRTEVIAARMKKILALRHKSAKAGLTLSEFKHMILANCSSVNIWIINIYLYIFVKINKYELTYGDKNVVEAPFKRCWPRLKETGKIDVFTLLNLNGKEMADIINQMELQEDEWLFDANVQTFAYFAQSTPDLISTMDTLFNGDFTYDDSGKKNCLKDALKNYAFTYNLYKLNQQYSTQNEVERIAQILSRQNNSNIFEEICDEYILRSSFKKRTGEWSTMNTLWIDLLFCQNFKRSVAYYICRSEEKMVLSENCKYSKFSSLNSEDSRRINILQEAFCWDHFDDNLKSRIVNCYRMMSRAAEKTGAESVYTRDMALLKLLFSLEDDRTS